jgi:hypothetical protein
MMQFGFFLPECVFLWKATAPAAAGWSVAFSGPVRVDIPMASRETMR